jgi:hypothetical protein
MNNTASRANQARGRRSRLARTSLLALALAAMAGLGLLASACGGSSGEGVAQAETKTQTTTDDSTSPSDSGAADPTAYSRCMRENGVSKFPDPDGQGRLSIQGGPGLDPNSPQFQAAERACEKYMPRGGDDTPSPEEQEQGLQEALAYSACIREHGVPNYPDPKPNADGGIDLNAGASDFDPSSPQFKEAEEACEDLLPGGAGGSNQRSIAPGSTR